MADCYVVAIVAVALFAPITVALATVVVTLAAVTAWFLLSSLPFGIIVTIVTIAAVVTIVAVIVVVAVIAVALFAPVAVAMLPLLSPSLSSPLLSLPLPPP
jgi:hypothetical protein